MNIYKPLDCELECSNELRAHSKILNARFVNTRPHAAAFNNRSLLHLSLPVGLHHFLNKFFRINIFMTLSQHLKHANIDNHR